MSKSLFSTIRLAAAILITIVMFFPTYWLVVTSLKTPFELRLAIPSFWPESFRFQNYIDAFQASPFGRYFFNTAVQTLGIMILQINVAIWAAFAFAKGNFWGRDKWFILVLAALIVPEQVTFVPVYVMMSKIGWLNTFLALIVPHGASAYGIFLLRQAFKSLNNDVLEAARVDGAGRFHQLYRILVPMAMPTIATLIVLTFIGSWNSYFWPLIMTNSDSMRVLTVAVAMMRDAVAGDEALTFHMLSAASVMVILPIVIVFTFAQKHIVSALANSTFK
ncbi:carbohydrate ABC transporter permease [Paenibacillus alvei]|uniref:Carbohydrate ABC transporter permease n=1 Tax=Paenibacillus alvei TaxID=44250 RepID=A0AAP6ZY42_PAEAL|nr:carbohydrate ABC transporter permease [Paenibacillus alvei]MBG9737770.1 ABC transporter permease [Paenibacillus alvei]MBG9747462.1 ABC transporter permease [Paenibacillus alvei]MCY9581009.1 carbohydrate ABC transporter permease [Paenibacillus alvei]MCY9585727.1 carbohydrate ABC transporter permease [Paenibacillus alvei]NEZ40406.1 ABC transporter permease subunit [Paenibacillus alvei]